MAEGVVPLHSEPRTRRRRAIRPPHTATYERRKKKRAGFDIAAALEVNLDRYPTKEALWKLLSSWLDAAKREGLAASQPAYVKVLERAIVVMSKAPSPQHAIETLQAR
jgi:hypothetical protein